MGRMKFLGFSFLAAVLLVGINSCGVPSPVTPEVVTVEPVTGSTITSTDAIIVTFSTSMVPGTLTLTGDMVSVSDRGVWFQNNSTNDTLVIRPNAANGGIWSAGQHSLTIDVEATSGVAIQSLTLDYEIVATVPTVAVLSPENTSTIIGSTPIVIVFSIAMDPLTLVLSGDMAAVSDGGVWSTTLNENDTLVIGSSSAWSNVTENLIIDVASAEGASLSTLSLFYTVDVEVPTVKSVLPADTSAIQGSTPIVISFSLGMRTSTLNLSGSMADENPDVFWSSTTKAFDTLTITPSSGWSDGPHTVSIDAVAFNGFALPTENLSYEVDATLAVPAETPARNSLITSGEIIVIDFGEEMDIGTSAASGSLWDAGDGGVWSATNNILTISPATLWPVGPITLTLDIVDLVGNSIATLTLDYTVDVITPTVTAVAPVSTSILYNVNAAASADVVVISFSEKMAPTSLILAGDMATKSDNREWSNTAVDDDTLTIGASTGWNTGIDQSLDVTAEDLAGNPIVPLELIYTVVADLCSDGIQNQDETDIDCGGLNCSACSAGDSCLVNADCTSNICDISVTNICLADSDGDSVIDVDDNCPLIANPGQENLDGDADGDACDTDDDNDSVLDGADNCPLVANSAQENADGDAEGDACDTDDDNDSVLDGADNCPLVANSAQENADGDAEGDACDTDDDNDSVLDGADNCPLVANPGQENADGDAEGDACDTDDDNDTVLDGADNCPLIANAGQENADGDADGDACDTDDDNDSVLDGADNCPLVANPGQENADGDAEGDACDTDDDNDTVLDGVDNCPLIANLNQANLDGDALGDVCDDDDDGDTILDVVDNCPLIANFDQSDIDSDGIGDVCDL